MTHRRWLFVAMGMGLACATALSQAHPVPKVTTEHSIPAVLQPAGSTAKVSAVTAKLQPYPAARVQGQHTEADRAADDLPPTGYGTLWAALALMAAIALRRYR